MTKQKHLVARTPYGDFERTTTRKYTHVVVSQGLLCCDDGSEAEATEHPLVEFCGSYELALKKQSKYLSGKTTYGVRFAGKSEIFEVEVLEKPTVKRVKTTKKKPSSNKHDSLLFSITNGRITGFDYDPEKVEKGDFQTLYPSVLLDNGIIQTEVYTNDNGLYVIVDNKKIPVVVRSGKLRSEFLL